MAKKDLISIGNAGEYFVAGELERRGFTVGVPMSNVKDYDILAIHRTTGRKIAIQVKTTSGKDKKWLLSKKSEKIVDNDTYYVLVVLDNLAVPQYHIVPAKIMSETIKSEYNKWIQKAGKNGKMHNETAMRTFFDKNNAYLDKWDLLS